MTERKKQKQRGKGSTPVRRKKRRRGFLQGIYERVTYLGRKQVEGKGSPFGLCSRVRPAGGRVDEKTHNWVEGKKRESMTCGPSQSGRQIDACI